MSGDVTVQEVAGWDLPLLRGAVGTLGLVAERLLPWRIRLEALGRQLGTAECWSGPAGSTAAAAAEQLATVTSGVQTALDDAHGHLGGLVTEAAAAQHQAEWALAVAASVSLGLDAAGRPVPDLRQPTAAMAPDQRADLADRQAATGRVAASADEALAAAARVLTAALTAGAAVRQAGVPAAAVFGFSDLAARLAPIGPVVAPRLPTGGGPAAVATWWTELSAAQQSAVVEARPAQVGALDGLPGWARDLANRRLLDQALRNLPPGGEQRAMATAVAAVIERAETGGRPVQLLQFQPAENLVALSLGDVDTAEAIAVLVPGIRTTPADDLGNMVDDAADVSAAARAAAPGTAVAAVAWLGYRTPGLLGAPFRRAAERAAPALDRALDGLAATRAAPGAPPRPRTTVLAHSYGTLVTGRAAREPGRLAADAVVLLGSPGVEAWTADALEAAEVYGAWSPADPVAVSAGFGSGPTDPWFGDTELPTDLTQGHTEYYDPDRPTLAALGEVVAGTRGPG